MTALPFLPVLRCLVTGLCLALATAAVAKDNHRHERQRMVDQLQRYGSGVTAVSDEAVLAAMGNVPRHRFVPPRQRNRAYQDRPLPIGHGQTISQPYIVALMTQLADVEPGMRVLEVGTGSGYQAAVLAELTDQVYTIEIIEPLARQAAARFQELAYDNIVAREGDGYYGWQEHAPFDRIVVTAAAEHIPPPLVEQIKPGGHMVIPVGSRWGSQQLLQVFKEKDQEEGNKVRTRILLPVRFVPLTGDH